MRDTHNRQDFFFFFLDGWYAKDDKGWTIVFRTPLFGAAFEKNWINFYYVDERRITRLWVGVIARWPCHDGGIMYRKNWEKMYAC